MFKTEFWLCTLLIFNGALSVKAQNETLAKPAEVAIEKVPYMAYIECEPDPKDEDFTGACSGSIINKYYILTAAHCFPDNKKYDHKKKCKVRVGSRFMKKEGKLLKIRKVIIHKSYCKKLLTSHSDASYDIALIKVKGMKFSEKIQPVILLKEGSVIPNNTNMIAPGWGLLKPQETVPPVCYLRWINISMLDICQCMKSLCKLSPGMLCGVGPKQTPCFGDDGGPLVVMKKCQRAIQVGITSLASPNCTEDGKPTYYLGVSHYMKWIRNQTRKNLKDVKDNVLEDDTCI